MATQDVKFIIAVEDAGAIRKLTETERALYDLQNTSKKTGASMSVFGSEWKRLTASFVSGQIIVDGIRKAFGILKGEISAVVKEAIEAEKVDRALEAALTITGQAAGGAAAHFKNYATQLQKQTIYDDEAIKSAQTLMIQMGLSTGVIDKATRGAIGLSAVFGQDLASSARAVALGFQGNYRAIGMLIPAVRQATTEGEKQAAMMKSLGEYYQRAEADVNTFAGRLDQIKNAYNELRGSAGELVINNKAVLTSLEGIKSIIEWLDLQVKKKSAGGGDKKSILDYFGPGAVWNAATSAISGAGEAARKAVDDYANSWEGMAAAVLAARGNVLEPIPILLYKTTKSFGDASSSVKQFIADLNWLRMFGTGITGAASTGASSTIGGIVGGGLGEIIDSFDQIEGLFENMNIAAPVKKETDKMSNQFAGVYNSIADGFTRAFEQFKLTAKGFADFFVAIWEGIKQAFFRIIAEMVAKFVAFRILTGIGGLLGGPIGAGMLAAAGGLKFWAEGFHGIVQQPTLALIGERGPERVDVGPVNSRGGGGVATNINVSIYALDNSDMERAVRQRVVPILKEVYAHGGL